MKKVLIVDDAENYRVLVRSFLAKLDFEVYDADDGRYAERLIKEHGIDILVTDIVMQDKEGLETITLVKKKFPHVKIIAISGGGMSDAKLYLDMAKKLGADSTLKKPFKKEAFLHALEEQACK